MRRPGLPERAARRTRGARARTTAAGSATSAVSTNSPGAASTFTSFFISPYRPKVSARLSAIHGGRP